MNLMLALSQVLLEVQRHESLISTSRNSRKLNDSDLLHYTLTMTISKSSPSMERLVSLRKPSHNNIIDSFPSSSALFINSLRNINLNIMSPLLRLHLLLRNLSTSLSTISLSSTAFALCELQQSVNSSLFREQLREQVKSVLNLCEASSNAKIVEQQSRVLSKYSDTLNQECVRMRSV